jgi:hypothetical protein
MTAMNAASWKARRKKGSSKTSSNHYLLLRVLLGIIVVLCFLVYLSVIGKFHSTATLNAQAAALNHVPEPPRQPPPSVAVVASVPTANEDVRTYTNYQDWRKTAVQLATLTPDQVLLELETSDPFGVRTFEQRLKEEEIAKQRILTTDELQQLFPCPTSRITLPEQRDLPKAQAFRHGHTGDTFLLFQHLRKAGGTNFCTLAEHNLPPAAVSHYYCMPDIYWHSKRQCAGCLKFWTNAEIEQKMKQGGHRIQGNEWDEFQERLFDLPAALATSFRKPLDRMLSQFRFECVEDRGCKDWDLDKFRTERDDLANIYTRTFNDEPRGPQLLNTYLGTSPEDGKKRGELMGRSLDNVAKFHLVMVMEWLAYSHNEIKTILGFQDTSVLTQRVRPHIGQAKRNDGQETNKLGAAGITKASWDPKDKLTPKQFKEMSERLAMDEILTDAARRMFLERLVCPDVQVSD